MEESLPLHSGFFFFVGDYTFITIFVGGSVDGFQIQGPPLSYLPLTLCCSPFLEQLLPIVLSFLASGCALMNYKGDCPRTPREISASSGVLFFLPQTHQRHEPPLFPPQLFSNFLLHKVEKLGRYPSLTY